MPVDPRLRKIAEAICASVGLTLVSDVGAGAFKQTFEVRCADGTPRALKVYQRAGADARTDREVDAIRRCSHPGVARFESISTWQDGSDVFVYSVEEFLAGGTLTARIAKGLLTPVQAIALGARLADAVGHVASLGLVHRDLKPDNIMFRAADEPVIVDFGLVRDLNQLSLTKTWLPRGPGTPYFAPPEQLNNQKALIDWRADQFSLGVLLTLAAYGHHPYEQLGDDPYRVVDRVAQREPIASSFEKWATTVDMAPLVKMVGQWPVNRFRTPRDLAAAWKAASA